MRSKSAKRKERNYTSARERAEKASSFTSNYLNLPSGVQMLKTKAGQMLLDIMPYEVTEKTNKWAEPGSLYWERTFYTHRGIGADEQSYLCAKSTFGHKCPVCELRAKLTAEQDEEKEELIQSLAPKQRQLFNIINAKDPDKGVQLLDISHHLFGKFIDAAIRNSDEDEGRDLFFSLEEGLTLRIGFAEKTFAGRNYNEVETIDFKVRKEPYDEEMLEKTHNLDKLLVETPYDELKKILLQKDADEDDDTEGGEDEDETDEEDEDEKPSKKSKSNGSGKSKKDRDEDVEDDEEIDDAEASDDDESEDDDDDSGDEDEEGDDDDDSPKSKGKSKKSKPAEDDDEDEEESDDDEDDDSESDDDDEDEEAPKSKKSKKSDDEDEEEDEPEDDDESDEDEEDEKPAKSKKPVKGKKSKSDDEGEEEEDDFDGFDDEDEEEDEAPKKKKKK